MKKIFVRSLFVGFVLIGFQGCYTILWTPDKKITDQHESTTYYYGYAPDFYNVPWWVDVPFIVHYPLISLPDRGDKNDQGRESETRNIRNNDGGRNSGERNSDIINTPPPTISSPGSSNPPTGSSSGSSSSGNTVRTETSGNNSSNSGSRNNDTRNNSGKRNSESGRK